mgnify:CR=1 FL=1
MTASGHEAGCGCMRCRGFEPGNVASLRHGALSARVVGDDVAALLAELRESGALWLEGVDAVARGAWAYAVVTCGRLRAWIDEQGDFDAKGEPRHAHKLLLSWERRLDRAQSALGFDPLSRARLGRDTAVARSIAADGVRAVAEAGREARMRALVGDGDGAA